MASWQLWIAYVLTGLITLGMVWFMHYYAFGFMLWRWSD